MHMGAGQNIGGSLQLFPGPRPDSHGKASLYKLYKIFNEVLCCRCLGGGNYS